MSSWGRLGMALPRSLEECWKDSLPNCGTGGGGGPPASLSPPAWEVFPAPLGFNKRLSVPYLPTALPAATTQVWTPNLWRPYWGLAHVGWSPSGTEGAACRFLDSFSLCEKPREEINNRNQA